MFFLCISSFGLMLFKVSNSCTFYVENAVYADCVHAIHFQELLVSIHKVFPCSITTYSMMPGFGTILRFSTMLH